MTNYEACDECLRVEEAPPRPEGPARPNAPLPPRLRSYYAGGPRDESEFFRANNRLVFCTPERIDAAIAGCGRNRNGLNYNDIRILLEQVGTLDCDTIVREMPRNFFRDIMPSARKRKVAKTSSQLRRLVRKHRRRVLDVCFRRPGRYCRAAWQNSA